MQPFVAVHVGAGKHAIENDASLTKLCSQACQCAMSILRTEGSALDAVQAATVCLENSPLTNAGFGSSLSRNGHVFCDASIADGKNTTFGCVGAVPGVVNPILLARAVLDNQIRPKNAMLVSPVYEFKCILTC